jgi:hypothetical protein
MSSLIRKTLLIICDPEQITDFITLEHTAIANQLPDDDLSVGTSCREQLIILEENGALSASDISQFFKRVVNSWSNISQHMRTNLYQ